MFSIDIKDLHSTTVLWISLFTLIIFLFVWKRRPNIKLPPGPSALPIIGNLHQINSPAFLTYDKFFQQYGDIFYIRLGQMPVVVLNSLEHMKACFSQATFSGRPQTDFQNYFVRDSGVALIDGKNWEFHRRLSLQILRNFGMGKSVSETVVGQEASELCQQIDKFNDKPNKLIDTSNIFSCTTMNIISQFTFGEQPGYENELFKEFMDRIRSSVQDVNLFNSLPSLFPILNIFGPIFRLSAAMRNLRVIHNFVLKKLRDHTHRVSETDISEASNYVEAYLLAKDQEEQKEGKESASKKFYEWQILRLILELYVAGMDTTSTTLAWTTLLLSIHDSMKQKMCQEIHNIIGKDKMVCMEDRKQFHYSLAVIDEIMRYSSLTTQGVLHRATENTVIDGYDIPKDTLILPNLYSIHHDPNIWEKPHEFYPQHFLSEDGLTYRPNSHLIPFGIGKRSCLGESLARIEIFMIIITLVQRYRFRVHFDPKKGESLEKCLIGTDGIVRAPGPHRIEFIKYS